jgi:hypothetical protein
MTGIAATIHRLADRGDFVRATSGEMGCRSNGEGLPH